MIAPNVIAKARAEGVLKPEHDRIVAAIDMYAARAGIAPEWITMRSKPHLSQVEVDFMRGIRGWTLKGVAGLAIVGRVDTTTKMSAMAAALVRMFIDARLCPMHELMDYSKQGDYHEHTVLLIPNLHVAAEMDKFAAQKQASAVGDVLVHRRALGKLTVVGVDSMADMRMAYGERIHDAVRDTFVVSGADAAQISHAHAKGPTKAGKPSFKKVQFGGSE